jgi:hypothetical protein
VPRNAAGNRGPYSAVVTEENKLDFRRVGIAFSNGREARLLSGVEKGERVALNPGSGVTEGEVVRPVERKTK